MGQASQRNLAGDDQVPTRLGRCFQIANRGRKYEKSSSHQTPETMLSPFFTQVISFEWPEIEFIKDIDRLRPY
jgi:hypothetical protein